MRAIHWRLTPGSRANQKLRFTGRTPNFRVADHPPGTGPNALRAVNEWRHDPFNGCAFFDHVALICSMRMGLFALVSSKKGRVISG